MVLPKNSKARHDPKKFHHYNTKNMEKLQDAIPTSNDQWYLSILPQLYFLMLNNLRKHYESTYFIHLTSLPLLVWPTCLFAKTFKNYWGTQWSHSIGHSDRTILFLDTPFWGSEFYIFSSLWFFLQWSEYSLMLFPCAQGYFRPALFE